MSNADRARDAMAEAVVRARQFVADRAAQATAAPPAASPAPNPGLEDFLRSYRELAGIAARLEQQLGADDPMRAEVQAALGRARQAWSVMLADGPETITVSSNVTPDLSPGADPPFPVAPGGRTAGTDAGGGSPPEESAVASSSSAEPGIRDDVRPRAGGSLELVHAPRERVAVAPATRLPDEAALVRYFRRRRERRRLPDESVIGRYLRERRERGPRYPDEATIARYLRTRRERR